MNNPCFVKVPCALTLLLLSRYLGLGSHDAGLSPRIKGYLIVTGAQGDGVPWCMTEEVVDAQQLSNEPEEENECGYLL